MWSDFQQRIIYNAAKRKSLYKSGNSNLVMIFIHPIAGLGIIHERSDIDIDRTSIL
jgi:hypothetical protein